MRCCDLCQWITACALWTQKSIRWKSWPPESVYPDPQLSNSYSFSLSLQRALCDLWWDVGESFYFSSSFFSLSCLEIRSWYELHFLWNRDTCYAYARSIGFARSDPQLYCLWNSGTKRPKNLTDFYR